MTDNKEKPKMGRPKLTVNTRLLERLCRLPKSVMSNQEVVYIMQTAEKSISYSTVERFVKKVYGCTFDDFRRKSNCKLRHLIADAQIKKAIDDENVTMLIWLGKQYLGQKDSNTTELGNAEIKDNKLVIDLGAAKKDDSKVSSK